MARHALWLGHHIHSNLEVFGDVYSLLEISASSSFLYPSPAYPSETESNLSFVVKRFDTTGNFPGPPSLALP